ncbi:MAG: ATP-binding cassette domain-containing protein [Rhodoferax sp.]
MVAAYVRLNWRPYVLAGLMLACVSALTVFIPRQVGHVVDQLAAGRMDADALVHELGWIVLAGVVIYGLRVAWRLQLFAASYRLGAQLRERLYVRLCEQGPQYFQERRTGDLMAQATNDIDAVEMASGEAMLAGFDGTLTLVMVVAMMTVGVDLRLALAALLPFPFMAWAFWRISNHIHQASAEALTSFGRLNDQVQESLAGVRTLRALGLEAHSSQRFGVLAQAAADASLRAQRWEAAFEPVVGMTLVSATVLTLGLGGALVWQGALSVGMLTAFSMYLGQLIWPMFAAGWVLALIERGRAAWARLQPTLDAPLSVEDCGQQSVRPSGTLRLTGVGVVYPGQSRWAIRDLNLVVPEGHTVGLVGPTGSGKSTVLRLILRQYAAQSGAMLWGEHALDAYRLEALRQSISWVPQEPFLFSSTLAQNIALVCPQADRQAIERAARLASVHEDIVRMPQGYDTPVGEKGITLSGGQRQRVAIARALLTDTPLLLLDDALSAVDTQTETEILRHLREERRGRQALIVSHRLSAVADADHIVVLSDGSILEQGTHDDLMRAGGWYATQWRYQQLEASLDAA